MYHKQNTKPWHAIVRPLPRKKEDLRTLTGSFIIEDHVKDLTGLRVLKDESYDHDGCRFIRFRERPDHFINTLLDPKTEKTFTWEKHKFTIHLMPYIQIEIPQKMYQYDKIREKWNNATLVEFLDALKEKQDTAHFRSAERFVIEKGKFSIMIGILNKSFKDIFTFFAKKPVYDFRLFEYTFHLNRSWGKKLDGIAKRHIKL